MSPISMAKIAISLLLPLTLGYAWLGLFRPVGRRWTRLSLAVGFGFGLSSLLFFGWLLAVGKASAHFMLFQGLVTLAVIGVARWLSSRRRPGDSAASIEPGAFERKLGWAFGLILLLSLASSILQFLYIPHGHWDAWDLWNMRALFLMKAGQRWPEFFVAEMPRSMDYPLMLSATIAAAWKFIGAPRPLMPGAIAILFTLATIGLLTSSIQALRGRSQGWIAGILLASTPYFAEHGASQYADIELAFYTLGSVGLWAWSDRDASPSAAKIALSGMLAG
ncbi:MAG TPA: hypothetical protein VJR29_08290, partial [bacterium]|nr:hypothetical protein [bacterium]